MILALFILITFAVGVIILCNTVIYNQLVIFVISILFTLCMIACWILSLLTVLQFYHVI